MKENVDVKIVDFINLNASIKKHLHAYGLTNGRIVRVISNRPEMIIQIEETELALEHSVARKILVLRIENHKLFFSQSNFPETVMEIFLDTKILFSGIT